MMMRIRPWILGVVFASSALCAQTPIESAFDQLYRFHFSSAYQILDTYIAQNPDDPLGYSTRASVLLFEELNSLQLLESEFFEDDKRIIDKKKLKPDPVLKARFMQAIEEAQRRAKGRLAIDPNDTNAEFALCAASGLTADYVSLVEKKQWSSLSYVKEAHLHALRLIKATPPVIDAYVTTGISEYVIGSLPFFLRWFVHFNDVEGSKDVGTRDLEKVARSGHYLKSYAKILLSIVYLREKKPQETRKLLVDLNQQFPENPLIRKELDKLNANAL
jgi:hypothetical protein